MHKPLANQEIRKRKAPAALRFFFTPTLARLPRALRYAASLIFHAETIRSRAETIIHHAISIICVA
ncbi:MAG: hypothetical protein IJ786_00125 [Bacteroidaceae bacterium]|nr:hypothetical protein [Bacteroidaceae bacterium]